MANHQQNAAMKHVRPLVAAAAVTLSTLPASAQTYPTKPIKILVSTPPPGIGCPTHTAAMASISSRKFGLARPRRMQSVLPGGCPAKYVCNTFLALGTSCGLQM